MKKESIKTDQEIVRETLLNKHAFSELVKRYEASLRRYVKRLGCKDNDLDDVLQEVFIKVFLNLNDYDQNLKFSSWLFSIAHNEAISFFRKKKITPSVLNLSEDETETFFEQLADDTDFVDLANKRYEAIVMRDVLSKLDPKYGEVLILRFLEEKSYTEISDILKLPEGTVATLISRGKKELKTKLESKGITNI